MRWFGFPVHVTEKLHAKTGILQEYWIEVVRIFQEYGINVVGIVQESPCKVI